MRNVSKILRDNLPPHIGPVSHQNDTEKKFYLQIYYMKLLFDARFLTCATCIFKTVFSRYARWHKSHLNSFSSKWVRRWFFNVHGFANFLSHKSQARDFSPVWMCIWLVNWYFFAKPLSHSSHRYGRSPVCIRIWTVKWIFCTKHRPHVSQR